MNCKSCGIAHSPEQTNLGDFLGRTAFRFNGANYPFPAPELCYRCLHQHRLSFRNERSYYPNTHALTGERLLSQFHPTPLWGEAYQLLPEDEWRGGAFDPLDFGREIDFSRPFFEQYAELTKAVPRMSIVNINNDNSPYTSHTGYSKNCYLLPCSEHCEDCYYGRFLQKCSNCLDCTSAHRSELCYECFQISDCYNCAFLSLSNNCRDCYFSEGLTGCSNCLFCSNLRRGEYQIFNTRVSPGEFRQQYEEIFSSADAMATAYRQWQLVRSERAHRPANIINCEHSTGDFLLDSKNCQDCVDTTECEDCREILIGYKLKDSRSCSNVYLPSELNYEILGSAELYHCAFGIYVFRSSDIVYSEYIYDSKRLFGCVGMTRAENCILNRQYSAEDYERTAARLVEHMQRTGEWGAQLPASLSPYGYNETVANDYFPLDEQAARAMGFHWRSLEEKAQPACTTDRPPSVFTNYGKELLSEVFRCEESGQPFRFISQELDFYRRAGYALPRLSPRARHQRREQLRFPFRFHNAPCSSCQTAVVTNVPDELLPTLHCEECFQRLF